VASNEANHYVRSYLTREPIILGVLSGLAMVSFLLVGGLSHVYHAQQEALGNRWFNRGVADLSVGRFDSAVREFRAALLYARDDYDYQLNLAEALIGAKRIPEAYSYLLTLWEQQPENGLVNLELGRITAQRGETEQALRYYHNAIYAAWTGDQEKERQNARLELIEFLLRNNADAQAQSELIALAANLPDDPLQRASIGSLFLRTQDYDHALAEFRSSLRAAPHNAPALAGAGEAAFHLGRYSLAQHYLQAVVSQNPGDTQSAQRLKTTELVLRMDPFRRPISAAQRARIVLEAYDAAGRRIQSCTTPASARASPQQAGREPGLRENWQSMKPEVTARALRRDPDLVEDVMDLVFRIERQAGAMCGPPTETDTALLLIAKLHEAS